MKTLNMLLAIVVTGMAFAPGPKAQTVTGSGDPDYIPLWISTGAGGGNV